MTTKGSDNKVGECAPEHGAPEHDASQGWGPTFSPDELEGFEQTTLELPSEADGQLVATLIRTVGETDDRRPAILYVHGFVDYFFQIHLARAFEEAGFRFYALDLRRYGRSLRDGNRPGFALAADEYFVEFDWAFDVIRQRHPRVAAIVAHSTGGLISALYLDARRSQKLADCLIVSSPFLRFHLAPLDRALSVLVAGSARFFPYFKLPLRMKENYGKTLHLSYGGEWNYDVLKKPLAGYPLYAGWFRMIRHAHARVRKGLSVDVPILSLHSDKSHLAGVGPVEADSVADIVLDVDDIKKLSPRLGRDVSLIEVRGAVHDLTLSRSEVRDFAISNMVKFAANAVQSATVGPQDPCATS